MVLDSDLENRVDFISKMTDPILELILQGLPTTKEVVRTSSVLLLLLDQGLVTGNGGLPPYPLPLGGLGVYCAGNVLNYSFLASRLQSASLQTKLLRLAGIVDFGPFFDDALCVFNTTIETGLLSNPSEIAASKLMKKLADIYFTRVTNTTESTFFLISSTYGFVKISSGGLHF
ncbi:hypothetical protein Tco_0295713 [Tanacetum coccineum]